jgi:hypothetical protein
VSRYKRMRGFNVIHVPRFAVPERRFTHPGVLRDLFEAIGEVIAAVRL